MQHRWWYAVDGVARRRIDLQGGRLEPRLLRYIAIEYSVSRGIPNQSEYEIAHILNDEVLSWPESLVERANACVKTAELIKDKNLTYGAQISAVSKFAWFIRPAGWTLYDDLAAAGLGLFSKYNRVDRMKRFYKILDEWGFDAHVMRMQVAIEKSGNPELHAARIVDKLLMLHGMKDDAREYEIDTAKAYLDLLPEQTRSSLQILPRQLWESSLENLDAVRKGIRQSNPCGSG